MTTNWPSVELRSLVEPERGISYGIVQPGATVSDGIPVVRVSDVRASRIKIDAPLRVSKEVEAAYSRTRLRGGELLITIVGTVGETAIVPNSLAGWNVARAIAVLPIKSEVGARWVKWALLSPTANGRIQSRLNTTVQPTLNLGDLAELPILLPPPLERHRIEAILGALDDKIDLNRRMNETLEAMARALFKDWFVDFGPTRAKMEGRAPYLAPKIWALFPDRLNDEGTPEGWKIGTLDQLIEIGPSEPMRKGELAPYLEMSALLTQGPISDLPILREYSSGTRFRNGDTLLARITPCLENGKTAFVQNLPANAVGWGSTEFIVMRSISQVPRAVSYLLAREPAFRRHAIQSMTGTSGRQRARADAISAFPVTIPSDAHVWAALGSILTPTFAKIAGNADETQTLAATRDLLLPKLMSGEIRVRDAEKIAEAAA